MLFKSLGWPSFIFWFLRQQSRHFVSFRPWTRDVAICVKSSKLGTWYSERVILQFMCVGSLAGVTYLRYAVLMSPNKDETADHLRSYFIGSCHVGVSKRFSRSISLAVNSLPATHQSSYLPAEKLSINWMALMWSIIWNKYLLLTEFEGRTVSYGPSFFLLDLWPKREARGP